MLKYKCITERQEKRLVHLSCRDGKVSVYIRGMVKQRQIERGRENEKHIAQTLTCAHARAANDECRSLSDSELMSYGHASVLYYFHLTREHLYPIQYIYFWYILIVNCHNDIFFIKTLLQTTFISIICFHILIKNNNF